MMMILRSSSTMYLLLRFLEAAKPLLGLVLLDLLGRDEEVDEAVGPLCPPRKGIVFHLALHFYQEPHLWPRKGTDGPSSWLQGCQ